MFELNLMGDHSDCLKSPVDTKKGCVLVHGPHTKILFAPDVLQTFLDCYARSDMMPHFVKGHSEKSYGVRIHTAQLLKKLTGVLPI